MAVSLYDEQFLTDEQKRQLQAFTDAWNRANAAGDQAGMDSAHAAAERVRAQAGYSGGMDGSGYMGTGGSYSGASGAAGYAGGYSPSVLPSYRAQTDEVNRLYDAARDAELAGLKTAFDASSAELEAQREAIPEIYQAQKNSTAAQAEQAGRNFNEYAAASGLNSGAGGQARLAMSNQLQGDLTALGAQEASAQRELANDIAQLKIKYQNDIASAVANGEYRRAAALLEEYRREQESAVSVAGDQADENYRAWQSQFAREQYDYDRSRDTAEDIRRQESLRYERAQDEAARAQDEWERQLEMAELMAKYGDYSGLRALGIDMSRYEIQPVTPVKSTQRSSGKNSTSNSSSDKGGDIKLGTAASGMAGEFQSHPGSASSRAEQVGVALKNGYITREEADYLLGLLGL